jgi:GTP cyclohydrolase IA
MKSPGRDYTSPLPAETEEQTSGRRAATANGLAMMSEDKVAELLDAIDTTDLFREFMRRFGVNINDEHFKGTPGRVVRMYRELLKGYKRPDFKMTTFEAGEKPSLITVANLNYYSLCSHHLQPFFGVAHVSYLPDKRIAGLSKFARVVRYFSSKLQVQERLTVEITDYLEEKLKPRALAVMMSGEHLCMAMRGIKSPGHTTTTSQMRGLFITDPGLKAEFFKILSLSKK